MSGLAENSKGQATKTVKINANLHHILKTHVAIENDGKNITDHINKAVEEYFSKHDIKPLQR